MHLAFFRKLAGGWGKIGIIIPIFVVFLMSQNVAAASSSITSITMRDSNTGTDVSYSNLFLTRYSKVIASNGGGNYWRVNFNLNVALDMSNYDYIKIVYRTNFWYSNDDVAAQNICPFSSDDFEVVSCDYNVETQTKSSLQSIVTLIVKTDLSSVSTISTLGRFMNFSNFSSSAQTIYWQFLPVTVETVSLSDSAASAVQQQTQLQIQADNNISNQSSSSFGDISSPITTNLIGVLSSFVSSLSSITPAQTCELNLPFPAFAGGNWQVNPCQLPSEMVTWINVFASVIALFFYIPLITLLLKMIIGEIRSFQN